MVLVLVLVLVTDGIRAAVNTAVSITVDVRVVVRARCSCPLLVPASQPTRHRPWITPDDTIISTSVLTDGGGAHRRLTSMPKISEVVPAHRSESTRMPPLTAQVASV